MKLLLVALLAAISYAQTGVTLNGQPATECNECEGCWANDSCERDGVAPWCGMACCDGSSLVENTCKPDATTTASFLPLPEYPYCEDCSNTWANKDCNIIRKEGFCAFFMEVCAETCCSNCDGKSA